MTNIDWFIIGALAWAFVTKRAAERKLKNQWHEDVPVNGTDFQGAIWDRLNGTDLLNARWEDRNLAGSIVADPGRIGQAQLGLQPDWAGNL